MDLATSRKIVQETFESPFDKRQFRFFTKSLLKNINEANAIQLTHPHIPEAFRQYVQSYERLGTYVDPEKNEVDLLIVNLQKETSLERARTAQRNFIAHHLKQRDRKEAALVAFAPPNPSEWRFSLVKMDYKLVRTHSGRFAAEEELTPARRWSFLVGANESSHTAQSRFAPIIRNEDEKPILPTLEKAFNIETVTREFYEQYKDLFEKLAKNFHKNKSFQAIAQKETINVENFSKKLLGQIVFIYFLQKKGWLGVPRDKGWGQGDKVFLRTLFDRAIKEDKNFYNDCLEHLFYDVLNNPRREELDPAFSAYFDCKIPFLNGGLFEPDYDWENTTVNLDNRIFEEVIDTFDLYNFTVKEDEPLEKEVAVDPEMLGKVFENLLPENLRKGQGTYYTPREIVHYMCQESLINHLAVETKVEIGKVRRLVTVKDNLIADNDEQKCEVLGLRKNEAEILDNALVNIKVCDPACGSGAFLVGMLHEIVAARRILNPREKEHQLKKETIRNCIYGVDIDPGAVEIAKLRLWLSLVVDYALEDIEPLPNLDYKIMCGNSLIGIEKNLFNQYLLSDLEKSKALLFNEARRKQKDVLKRQIDSLLAQIVFQCKDFDFSVYFSEVFSSRKGFDIVIANPPYIGESGNKEKFRLVASGNLKPFYQGKMDYFYFFLHLALNLGRDNAECAFITTNYFITAQGAKKLRVDLKKRAVIKKLINFNELKIFESARGQHSMVTIFSKKQDGSALSNNYVTKQIGLASSSVLEDILSGRDKETDHFQVKQDDLYEGEESYVRICGTDSLRTDSPQRLLGRIKEQGQLLGSLCNVNQGVVSGCDYVSGRNIEKLKNKSVAENGDGIFVFDWTSKRDRLAVKKFSSEEKKLLRDFYKNSDIAKYWSQSKPTKFLLYLGREQASIRSYANIQTHLNKFAKVLKDRREVKKGIIPFFQLQWPRSENIFTGPKIVISYRTPINAFAYNETEWFCRSDVYVITSRDGAVKLKYVLALLNSKLYYLWLFHKGKRKGSLLELFQAPLSEIPIKLISEPEQRPFVAIVDKILSVTCVPDYFSDMGKQARVKEYERQIDQMVCKLYNLTDAEIKIVEESAPGN